MQNLSYENELYLHENTVADSDLQIRGGGAVIQTLRYGGPVSKKFFRIFGPQFCLKVKGGGPHRPLSATGIKDHFQINDFPFRLALEQGPGVIRKWPIN